MSQTTTQSPGNGYDASFFPSFFSSSKNSDFQHCAHHPLTNPGYQGLAGLASPHYYPLVCSAAIGPPSHALNFDTEFFFICSKIKNQNTAFRGRPVYNQNGWVAGWLDGEGRQGSARNTTR